MSNRTNTLYLSSDRQKLILTLYSIKQHIISAFVFARSKDNAKLGEELFQENKEHRSNQATECHKMVPLQGLTLEEHDGKDGEDSNGNHLLDDLELHQCEGASITYKSHAVGRHLAGILEESQEPADENYDVERRIVRHKFHLLQLEMTVPSKSHEDV